MKCSLCKFYQKSKMFGNHCICTGAKPCEVDRNNKKRDFFNRKERKRKEKYVRNPKRQKISYLDNNED